MRLPDRSELLREARSLFARKHLGQNFLIEPAVLKRITGALELSAGDRVVEIGPGLGFLTRFLAATGAHVTAVELDFNCVRRLESLGIPNLTTVHGDFLEYKMGGGAGEPYKVVGNVPYQITSRIIAHVLGEIGSPSPWLPALRLMVLTMQHDVALRLVASPGSKDYSQITLLVNYFCRPEILEVVPAGCFHPAPKVTSAVVRFLPLAAPSVSCRNPRRLRQVIQAGFGQRRKMLKNNLGFLCLRQDEILSVFEKLHLDPLTRAERLSLEDFARLSDALEAAVSSSMRRNA